MHVRVCTRAYTRTYIYELHIKVHVGHFDTEFHILLFFSNIVCIWRTRVVSTPCSGQAGPIEDAGDEIVHLQATMLMKFMCSQTKLVPRTLSASTAQMWIRATPRLTRQTDQNPCLHNLDIKVSSVAFKLPERCFMSQVEKEYYFLNLKSSGFLKLLLLNRQEAAWAQEPYEHLHNIAPPRNRTPVKT
jgi:hypothetical protein